MKICLVPDWVLPFGYGLTLYKLVLVRKSTKSLAYTIAHEAEHVRQWTEEGLFKWPLKYFYYLAKYGYRDNPYEVQARKAGANNAHQYKNIT